MLQVLDVPAAYFEAPTPSVDPNPVFYRKLKSVRPRELLMAERRLAWLQHTIDCMELFVELPSVQLPEVALKSDPRDITNNDVEAAALEARNYWKLGSGAISSVVRLLENHGSILVRDALGVDGVDAFSQWQYRKHRPIIALSRDDDGIFFREQASAAHELGHLLLHRGIDKRFTVRESPEHDLLEAQANRFAGAFLLPADAFKATLRTASLDAFYLLKPQWIVSIGLMIYRSKDLGLIDQGAAARLWRQRTKRGWNRQEPLDLSTPVEAPRILAQGIEALKNVGAIDRWINDVRLSKRDIAQFASIDPALLEMPAARPRLRAVRDNTHLHE